MSNEQPAADAAPPAGGPRQTTLWNDILEMIKEIPGVGPVLVFISRRWGFGGFLLFLSGALVASLLVYFGFAPDFVVSDKYRRERAAAPSDQPPKNPSVKAITEQPHEWLRPYLDWMEDEGDAGKGDDPTLRVAVGAVETVELTEPARFTWRLRPNPGFELDGRAFRLTAEGMIRPLAHSPAAGGVKFDVPACERGDRLVAVVMSRWRTQIQSPEIKDTFTSHFEKGADENEQH